MTAERNSDFEEDTFNYLWNLAGDGITDKITEDGFHIIISNGFDVDEERFVEVHLSRLNSHYENYLLYQDGLFLMVGFLTGNEQRYVKLPEYYGNDFGEFEAMHRKEDAVLLAKFLQNELKAV